MKFGKQFEFHKIPEWSDNYLDYLELKLLLKEIKISSRKGKIDFLIFSLINILKLYLFLTLFQVLISVQAFFSRDKLYIVLSLIYGK